MAEFSKNPSSSDIRMGGKDKGIAGKGGECCGECMPKAASKNPTLKPVSAKGIAGKSGSLGAGQTLPRPKLKGF
jgi:hypothetical protein